MGKKKNRTLQKIKNDFIYYTARVLFLIAEKTPLTWGIKIGAVIGKAAWHLLNYERNCAMNHIKLAFPDWSDEQCAKVGKASFRNLGISFFEYWHMEELLASRETDNPYVTIPNRQVFLDVLEKGKGGIIVTGHFGNWELMAANAAYPDLPGNTVVRSLYDPRLDKMLNDRRTKFNYKPLARGGQQLIMDIQEVVQRNEFLALLIDQDTKVRGVFADFLGHKAWTPSGAAYLALMAGFDIIVMTMHRRPEGGHQVELQGPVEFERSDDIKADTQRLTELLNSMLSEQIRKFPEEWVWIHRRWKTRPEGEPPEDHPAPRPRKPWKY